MLVSPGPSKNTKSKNAEMEKEFEENMLAPIGEQGQEAHEVPMGMGRRRENPDRGGTGAAPGDVGPHMERKEGTIGEGLGQGVAAEIEEGEGEEGRKESASSSHTIQPQQSRTRRTRIDPHTIPLLV